MNRKSHNRCAAQCVAALILAFALSACCPTRLVNLGSAKHVTCTEDMRCWDCTTMGNHVCGTPQQRCERKYGPHVDSYVNKHGDIVCEYVKP